MCNEWIKTQKALAGRALYGFYQNRFSTIEVAVEWVVGEAVPEFPEGTTFREIMFTRQVIIQKALEWTQNVGLQEQAKKDVQEYDAIANL